MGGDQAAPGQVALSAAAKGAGKEEEKRFAAETEEACRRFEPHHGGTGVKDWVSINERHLPFMVSNIALASRREIN